MTSNASKQGQFDSFAAAFFKIFVHVFALCVGVEVSNSFPMIRMFGIFYGLTMRKIGMT